MDFIDPLWSFAAEWKVRILALIIIANMLLAVRLYGLMAKMRFKAAKEGRVTVDTYRATQNEPEDVAVFNRAVSNQFESPVLFYALVIMAMALGVTSWITVVLAAVYVTFRWLHAAEMTGPHDVMKRRQLFIRSITTLMVLMAEVAISTLLKA
ncbi:MAG: MAPEG family protein [Pseudomonadota bacterium]